MYEMIIVKCWMEEVLIYIWKNVAILYPYLRTEFDFLLVMYHAKTFFIEADRNNCEIC